MDVSSCSTSSHFPCWYVPQNLLFCIKYVSSFRRNDTVLTIKSSYMLPEALLTILIHPRMAMNHSSSNGCVSSRQRHHFFGWPSSAKTMYFVWNSRVVLKKMLWYWPLGGSHILIADLQFIIIHLMMAMKRLSSNGCLFIQHIIPFPLLIWASKFVILHQLWELLSKKWHCFRP